MFNPDKTFEAELGQNYRSVRFPCIRLLLSLQNSLSHHFKLAGPLLCPLVSWASMNCVEPFLEVWILLQAQPDLGALYWEAEDDIRSTEVLDKPEALPNIISCWLQLDGFLVLVI